MTKSLNTYKIFFVIMGIVSVGAIATNLLVRQGPVRDANAVDDLRSISGAMDGYMLRQSQLPASLSDLSGLSAATRQRLSNYEYIPGSSTMYKLCTTFESKSTDDTTVKIYPAPGNADPGMHGAGRQCFSYIANSGQPVPLSK
jgi:type II secretory pathway pseudopilin PulG